MLFSLSLMLFMTIEETQAPVIHSEAIEFLTRSGSLKRFDMDLVSLSSSTVPQFSAAPFFTLKLVCCFCLPGLSFFWELVLRGAWDADLRLDRFEDLLDD